MNFGVFGCFGRVLQHLNLARNKRYRTDTHNTSSTNKKSNLANRQQQADTFRTKLPNEDLLLQNPASETGVFGFSEMTCGVGDGGRRGDVNLRGCGGGK